MSDKSQATLACFVSADENEKYALTAGHVTKATTGCVYVGEQKLGECQDKSSMMTIDVGLVKIFKQISHLCRNDVYDIGGQRRAIKVFDGSIDDIYSKTVFKCIPIKKRAGLMTSDFGTPLTGTVASKYRHDIDRDSVKRVYFLVKGNEYKTFAREGESGTLLGLQDNSCVYLVGIIIGGLKSESSDRLVICSFLPEALRYLSREKQMNLSLCESEQTTFKSVLDENKIVCGAALIFQRPETVAETDFDIAGKLLDFICFRFHSDDSSKGNLIAEYERQSRRKVFARKFTNNMAVYTPEGAEQVTLLYFYLTVQHLYASKCKEARETLKRAMRSLLRVNYSLLKLVCKCITYVTWLYLEDGSDNDSLENIFEEGFDFMLQNRDQPNFPLESLGYHYYDYSRYLVNKGQRQRAIDIARMGYESLKFVYEAQKNTSFEHEQDSFNRYVFGLCQYADSLLWCGEHFEYTTVHVPADAVQRAEELLSTVANKIDEAPGVQRVYYLLSLCDLHYRRNEISEAFGVARRCLQLARDNNMVQEQCSAGYRCKELKKTLKTLKGSQTQSRL